VVVQLAEDLDAGVDCAAALQDALVEVGRGAWAEHSRDLQADHPKGCAWLDVLLGKS